MTDKQTTELADDLFPAPPAATSPEAEYLLALDEYTRLREQLSKQFSEGFIELSRANYASGRQFGRVFWDEGAMTATRTVGDKREAIPEEKQESGDVLKQRKKEKNDTAANPTDETPTETPGKKDKKKTKYDPINMFGAIVPYQLRNSQKSFQQSINTIEQLTAVTAKLSKLYDENVESKQEHVTGVIKASV